MRQSLGDTSQCLNLSDITMAILRVIILFCKLNQRSRGGGCNINESERPMPRNVGGEKIILLHTFCQLICFWYKFRAVQFHTHQLPMGAGHCRWSVLTDRNVRRCTSMPNMEVIGPTILPF